MTESEAQERRDEILTRQDPRRFWAPGMPNGATEAQAKARGALGTQAEAPQPVASKAPVTAGRK